MQRSLKPQSTGQHRGDPPFRRCGSAATGTCVRRQFRKLPGAFAPRECESLHRPHFRIRGEIIIILRFERRVCRWESCRMHQFTGMWLNPNSRGSRLRIWQPWGCKSLHAHQPSLAAEQERGCRAEASSAGGLHRPHRRASARQAISRRLASAGTADPGDLKSPSLPGASPGSPTGVWLIGNSRPVRLKIEQPWECKSPHADQFGMSTRRAGRTCSLTSRLPERGVWCESTPFRHSCARSSKRAGGLIPRIALDQCRVPERYRTRVPVLSP